MHIQENEILLLMRCNGVLKCAAHKPPEEASLLREAEYARGVQ